VTYQLLLDFQANQKLEKYCFASVFLYIRMKEKYFYTKITYSTHLDLVLPCTLGEPYVVDKMPKAKFLRNEEGIYKCF
jgi:hypothetical protein